MVKPYSIPKAFACGHKVVRVTVDSYREYTRGGLACRLQSGSQRWHANHLGDSPILGTVEESVKRVFLPRVGPGTTLNQQNLELL